MNRETGIGTWDPAILEVAVHTAPSGIVVCDEAGVVFLANREAERIFGFDPGELASRTVEELFPLRQRRAYAAESHRFWEDPASWPAGPWSKLLARRKDGTVVPIGVGLTVVPARGKRLAVVSVVDLTQQRRLAREVHREAERQLGFERLVTALAARFVRLSPEDVDAAIVDSQRRIVEALDLDRCVLWVLNEESGDLNYTHFWSRPEFPPPPGFVSAREQFPWLFARAMANEAVWNSSRDAVPSAPDRENLARIGTRANAVIPMSLEGRVVGALSVASMHREMVWEPAIRSRLELLASLFAQVLERRAHQKKLRTALDEVSRLRDRLALENVQLQEQVETLKGPTSVVALSPAAKATLRQIESVAATDASVLLLGETGAGKEVFAQALHELSARRHRPMVRVNCAAIPTALLESELFGRERGAYTGALSRQIGRFELAQGTTLFLDEVGELSLEAQVKLLRVLQDKVVERLGGTKPIHVDVRIIAATNRDLARLVAQQAFREDLFHRLNVFPIRVPPLRERREDIPVLAQTFAHEFASRHRRRFDPLEQDSVRGLQAYSWPGNVREMRNLIERAVIVTPGPRLEIEIPLAGTSGAASPVTLAEAEIEHIRSTLERTRWRVRGPGGAAELLGVKPTTLESRMGKLGILRPPR